jgi:hypothetical protein
MSGPTPRTLLAIAAAAAVGCAAASAERATRDAPAASAWPEPDPACRVVVARSLALNGLEQVTVRAGLAPDGHPRILGVLGPALSPAATEDVRRAFAGCAWAPPAPGRAAEPSDIKFDR